MKSMVVTNNKRELTKRNTKTFTQLIIDSTAVDKYPRIDQEHLG